MYIVEKITKWGKFQSEENFFVMRRRTMKFLFVVRFKEDARQTLPRP
jgi:hypothetical protein